MTVIEPDEQPPKALTSSALIEALEGLGIHLGDNTVRVEIDFNTRQVRLHKLVEDERGVVQSFPDPNGGRYWATYMVPVLIH